MLLIVGFNSVNNISVKMFVNQAEADSKIRNKIQFYEGLTRIGWFLPSIDSQMCSLDLLKEVREGKCFCLKYNQVKLKSCFKPPTLKVLTKLLVDVINTCILERDESEQGMPSTWSLQGFTPNSLGA